MTHARAVYDEGVDEVADVEAAGLAEDLRADVALDQLRVRLEVLRLGLRDDDRFELACQPLEVDLSVPRHAYDEQRPFVLAGCLRLQHDVLQRVGRGDPQAEVGAVDVVDECLDGRCARRVEHALLVVRARLDGRWPRDLDGLGVRRVVAVHAVDECVLTGRGGREELLRRRAAHRARHGEHDAVVEADAREDALVSVAVLPVRLGETLVGEIERVRVLHDELAPAQDAGTRPCLVAVLRLDLVQRERIVLVGRVLALHQQREQFLVRRREQVVGVLAIVQPEQAVAVVGPTAARLEDLARNECREVHLLRADPVHLLADDALDLAEYRQAHRQPRVDARRDATDEPAAHEQLVARHLRVRRVVAKRAQEQRRHSKHAPRLLT